jgi:hypothetical protein
VFNRFGLVLKAALFAACVSPFASSAAKAENVRAVLELFTSQGCSSCPPADKLAAKLADESGLLVLSLPVDYWDYLGWKDTLAHSAFSIRQKGYAKARGDRQVYTPQIVINGKHHALGSDKDAIMAGGIAAGDLPYAARIERSGQDFIVVLPSAGVSFDAAVLVMPIVDSREVEIGRGENRGEHVTYRNVVRGISEIGRWSGAEARLPVPQAALKGEAGDADAFAVLVQTIDGKRPGAVLAAARSPQF